MKKYDVVAGVGTYQDRNTGEKKYINRNIGAVIQTDKGFRLCLDATFNPAGMNRQEDGKVWLSLFEPKPRDQQGGYGQSSGQTNSNTGSNDQGGGFGPQDDEIPFAPEWRG